MPAAASVEEVAVGRLGARTAGRVVIGCGARCPDATAADENAATEDGGGRDLKVGARCRNDVRRRMQMEVLGSLSLVAAMLCFAPAAECEVQVVAVGQ
jgi:hypothetical protein